MFFVRRMIQTAKTLTEIVTRSPTKPIAIRSSGSLDILGGGVFGSCGWKCLVLSFLISSI